MIAPCHAAFTVRRQRRPAALSMLLLILIIMSSLPQRIGNRIGVAEAAETKADDARNQSPNKLKLIYAGFPRHGTHSLRSALTHLGYHPCHGTDIRNMIYADPGAPLPQALIDRDVDAILNYTEALGYDSTLEIHGLLWREILERRPDLKYIFVPARPMDEFERSMQHFDRLIALLKCFPFNFVPQLSAFVRLFESLAVHTLAVPMEKAQQFIADPFDPDIQQEYYNARKMARDRYMHDMEEAVRKYPNNTLVFNPRNNDSFPELCRFLEITAEQNRECKRRTFPHKTKDDAHEVFLLQLIRLAADLAVLAVVIGAAWAWRRQPNSGTDNSCLRRGKFRAACTSGKDLVKTL